MNSIRRLDLAGIQTLLDWAAAEGWNPGIDDAEPFRAADPSGFFGLFSGERLAAGISVVAYDDRFAFLGLYICHQDFRGQGLGRAIWNAGMAYAGDRVVGLDGVPEQQANYRRMGFSTRYETVRMAGRLRGGQPARHEIVPLPSIESIRELDRTCFPAARDGFLQTWISRPRQALMAVRDGRVMGYMVTRRCRQGQKIGPLFAANAEVAFDLLGAVEGDVQIDVPVDQTAMVRHLEQSGFTSQFGTARMYRGPAPGNRLDWVFGVTTLELG